MRKKCAALLTLAFAILFATAGLAEPVDGASMEGDRLDQWQALDTIYQERKTMYQGQPGVMPVDDAPEDELLARLQRKTDNDVLESFFADYDDDGEWEAFCFTGSLSEYSDGESTYMDVWFVDENSARQVAAGDAYYYARFCMAADTPMVYAEEGYGGSGATSHLWYAPGGRAEEIRFSNHIEGFQPLSENDFIIAPGAFDATVDETGHTWKTYYLYFDGSAFREYGGISVAKGDLRAFEGAAEILEGIERDWEITDIFYRANDIVHINATDGENNTYYQLMLRDGELYPVAYNWIDEDLFSRVGIDELDMAKGSGVYEAAYLPDRATYPETLPEGATEIHLITETEAPVTPERDPGASVVSITEYTGSLAAKSSSYLSDNQYDVSARCAVDGDYATAWIEGVNGLGEGEWIEVYPKDGNAYVVQGLRVRNGYGKSGSLFTRNARVCDIDVYIDGEFAQSFTLKDRVGWQTLPFDDEQTGRRLRIEIVSAYPGTRYRDTCISEIALY